MANEKKSLTPEEAAAKKRTVIKLVLLIVITAVIFIIYRVLMVPPIFPFVLGTYLAVFTALIVVYLLYNRGFVRKNVTAEMLPDEWTAEQKREYIEDGRRRIKRSSWILMFIMAFSFTFAFELFELYFLPMLEQMLDNM